MDVLNDIDVAVIVAMTSAQVGKSEVENNMLAYYIAHDPCPILFLQPTLEMAEAYSKDRIAPMLRDCPMLAALVEDAKSRDAGNTLLHKQFPGGHLTLAGANSPASLASRPIRVVLADEIDRYPVSAGTEGDPLSLAIKRTTTFHDSKIIMCSTPGVKGASRVEQAFSESDQRRFYVPCPHCTELQTLVWAQVKWPPDAPDQAQYACPHCASLWTEAERAAAVRSGEWRATAPFNGTAGFHLNELYSPWRTLAAIVADFLAAKEYPERLKTFVNTSLGETWQAEATAVVEPHALAARAEPYALRAVPAGVGLVTGAVDTQGDRLEYYVWGFGEGEECWLLDRHIQYGDPAHEIVWQQMLERFEEPLTGAGGALVVPRAIAIDSGGLHTQAVYAFVRANSVRRTRYGLQTLLAVKGAKAAAAPIIGVPTSQEVNWRGVRTPNGVKLWPVGSSAAKALLYGRLKIETPGRGFVHFSTDLPEEVFEQITAERLVTKYVRGFGRLEWELQRGRRNEALDCFVYAYAAATHLGMQRMRPTNWANARTRLHGERAGAPPSAAPATSATGETVQLTPPPRPQSRLDQPLRRKSWITNW